ncbi:uncharacterized protein A1O9_04177 [Exophiala aquamarina CBS 119918]|uniref:FAS1 domain-containing protein n=1 Tax=Exophiala aquamarina CBS 119918 TaxID=1182545 RepID=A0A072PJ64_9EURO|nr:uncharacterized protein A1O9_04177 [Exophiala aquamarina CBS 119918]KEF59333.1 hypothetical protein A1O9_04177 [Exophiala aquamarina CBS 119918]
MPTRNILLKVTISVLSLANTAFADPMASAAEAEGSIIDQTLTALGCEQALRNLKDATLEDFHVESIVINPAFPENLFDGIPDDQSFISKAAPHEVTGISHARLTEFNSNMVNSGIPNTTVDDLKADTPVMGLPQVHWLIVDDSFLGAK